MPAPAETDGLAAGGGVAALKGTASIRWMAMAGTFKSFMTDSSSPPATAPVSWDSISANVLPAATCSATEVMTMSCCSRV